MPALVFDPRSNQTETRIHSGRSTLGQQLPELRAARELTLLLARREVQLRYRHSFAGIGWAVMQPVLTVLALSVFQLFLGGTAKSGIPYPLHAVTGLILWTFLSHCLTQCSSSILKYTSVIKKVHVPLLILPTASVLAGFVDLLVALPLVAALMVYYGYWPHRTLILLPLVILLLAVFAMALGTWLALLNTKYRDTSNALPFVMQLWFFLTPIVYTMDRVPSQYRLLVGLNPMVGIMEGFRMSLFGRSQPELGFWIECSVAISLVLLVSGVILFLREEDTLAEAI